MEKNKRHEEGGNFLRRRESRGKEKTNAWAEVVSRGRGVSPAR